MKIKSVCEITKLTDRTIRYYIEEKLISPQYTENYMGRRTFDFTEEDVKTIQNIAVLRKYGFSIIEIREMINNPNEIPRITKELEIRKYKSVTEEKELLEKLNQAIDKGNHNIAELAEFLSKPVEEKTAPDEKISTIISVTKLVKVLIKGIVVLLPIITSAIGVYYAMTKYLYLTTRWINVIIAILLLVPSVVLLTMSQRIKKKWVKILLIVLCALLPIPCFGNAYYITEDYSTTTNHYNYLNYDPDCLVYIMPKIKTLFWDTETHFTEYAEELDEWLPTDSSYYYFYQRQFLDGPRYDIYAEWPIERDDLDSEIARIKKELEKEDGFFETKNGDWTCLGLGDRFSTFVEREYYDGVQTCIFAYNEKTMRVRYILCEDQADYPKPPYYMSLEW